MFETDGTRAEIKNVLLSCRVLGRGIETALLATLCDWLFRNGHLEIVAHRIASARNAQTEHFFAENGFDEVEIVDGSSKWVLERSSAQPTTPDWITVSFRD
jgi:predicted enzyme involved in methoxymalonyl-ACP biosynthesis